MKRVRDDVKYRGNYNSHVLQKHKESLKLERDQKKKIGNLSSSLGNMLLHDSPINKDAKNVLSKKQKRKNRKDTIIYLIRLQSIENPHYKILKIGITSNLYERFVEDLYRYDVFLIKSVGGLSRKDALKIEKRLQRLLREQKCIPIMKLLSKGNTECFEDNNEVVLTTTSLFDILKEYSLATPSSHALEEKVV